MWLDNLKWFSLYHIFPDILIYYLTLFCFVIHLPNHSHFDNTSHIEVLFNYCLTLRNVNMTSLVVVLQGFLINSYV